MDREFTNDDNVFFIIELGDLFLRLGTHTHLPIKYGKLLAKLFRDSGVAQERQKYGKNCSESHS